MPKEKSPETGDQKPVSISREEMEKRIRDRGPLIDMTLSWTPMYYFKFFLKVMAATVLLSFAFGVVLCVIKAVCI